MESKGAKTKILQKIKQALENPVAVPFPDQIADRPIFIPTEQELAIGKAKIQIVSKLNLDSPNFNFEIVDVKFEKGKGNIICTVQIVARIK